MTFRLKFEKCIVKSIDYVQYKRPLQYGGAFKVQITLLLKQLL